MLRSAAAAEPHTIVHLYALWRRWMRRRWIARNVPGWGEVRVCMWGARAYWGLYVFDSSLHTLWWSLLCGHGVGRGAVSTCACFAGLCPVMCLS